MAQPFQGPPQDTFGRNLRDFFIGLGGGQDIVAQRKEQERLGAASAYGGSVLQENLASAGADPMARHAAIVQTIRQLRQNPELMADNPGLVQEMLAEAQALQAPQQVLSPGQQVLQGRQVVHSAPFAPSDAERTTQAIAKARAEGRTEDARLMELALIGRGPQAPQGTAFMQNMQFIAEQQGLDLHNPRQFQAALDQMAQMEQQISLNIPTGYAPTGQRGAGGLPEIAPLPGSEVATKRASAEQSRAETVETLDTVIAGIEANPGEFGVMAPLKEAGRRATSTMEQVGRAAQGVFPGAGAVAAGAGALRRGPLAEGNMTRQDAQTALDRVAILVARGEFGSSEAQRAAQQEINNVRDALQAGDLDPPTALRKLKVIRDMVAGEGFQAPAVGGQGAAAAVQGDQGGLGPALAKGDRAAVDKAIQAMSDEELAKLPPEQLDQARRLLGGS